MLKHTVYATLLIGSLFLMVGTARAQAPLAVGEHLVPLNGITLHYHVAGKGPVCLMPTPGWGIPLAYLMPQPVLEKHFTMVYYDTRGTGQSTGPADKLQYGLAEFMTDMDVLRTYLGQSKVWLAGHSDGGYIILNYAIHHNDQLNGLLVLGANAVRDSLSRAQSQYRSLIAQRKNWPYYQAHKAYYDQAAALMLGTDHTPHTLKEEFDLTSAFYTHKPEDGIKFFRSIQFSNQAAHYTSASKLRSKNLQPELHLITVPTLIISGDDDVVCDAVSQATRIHQSIASSQLVIIKECGHMLWAEKPREFGEICTRWLQAQHL